MRADLSKIESTWIEFSQQARLIVGLVSFVLMTPFNYIPPSNIFHVVLNPTVLIFGEFDI
jgi:hypothetical protein